MAASRIRDRPKELRLPMFIAMDPPRHDEQRKVVQPDRRAGQPGNMEAIIRERTAIMLDGLPRNETFDWVQQVSIELTTQMLATLFDFPFEDRTQADLVVGLRHGGAGTPAASSTARKSALEILTECATA